VKVKKYLGYFSPTNILKYSLSIVRIFGFTKSPILIAGCGRTGTSLMSAILDAHPEIVSLDHETYIFERQRIFTRARWNYVRNLSLFYLRLLRQGVPFGKKRWCEKTPRNVRRLDAIFDEFGHDIKVILMIRDGRDVLTSFHPGKKGEYYVSIERWVTDTMLTFNYESHKQVMLVPYEGLIENFEHTLKKVLTFLGSPYVDNLKQFDKFSSVQSHGAFHDSKLRPIYKESVERWRSPEHIHRVNCIMASQQAMALLAKIDLYTRAFLADGAH
jgi:hypothetical protein